MYGIREEHGAGCGKKRKKDRRGLKVYVCANDDEKDRAEGETRRE